MEEGKKEEGQGITLCVGDSRHCVPGELHRTHGTVQGDHAFGAIDVGVQLGYGIVWLADVIIDDMRRAPRHPGRLDVRQDG